MINLKDKSILIIIFIFFNIFAKENKSDYFKYNIDKEAEKFYINLIEKTRDKNLSISEIGSFFLGIPYLTNEIILPSINNKDEFGFNCITFLEMVLAIKLTASNKKINIENLINNLIKIKFKNNEKDKFHYSLDFINNNLINLKNITNKIFNNFIDLNLEKKYILFMSKNSDKYNFLNNNENELNKILEVENKLRKENFIAISKLNLLKNENLKKLKDGFLIFFVSLSRDLDISHCGIIENKNNLLSLIHASSIKKEIIKVNLLDYINEKKFEYFVICDFI